MLATKGPGDSLGLPFLMRSGGQDPRWRVFCRARGEVTVFTARAKDLQQLATQHPEIEPTVQAIATQQETDMAVADALRRLRLCSSISLTASAAALAGPGGGPGGVMGSGGSAGAGGDEGALKKPGVAVQAPAPEVCAMASS